jgi:hypothetical protein
MAKCDFSINQGTKKECKFILEKYHYLSQESKGFKTGENYILYYNHTPVGTCIFTGFPVPELLVGMFGIDRDTNQQGFYELSRLCLDPNIQKNEHNLSSWFVSRCIKDLKYKKNVRCILSYADSRYHTGKVYKALGFGYYGLSTKKTDFYRKLDNGEYKKQQRGKTKGIEGKWTERPRKHRYVLLYDNTLTLKWKKQKYIKGGNNIEFENDSNSINSIDLFYK